MPDAMVTARMSAQKKETGAKLLKSLGISASEAINQLYDYIIKTERLPFDLPEESTLTTEERLAQAVKRINDIPKVSVSKEFSMLSDNEIRLARLHKKGLSHTKDGNQKCL
ncbi:type II toxin-antitoxin system RelB/DinJ family antitoxin [Lancefieldella rimae]|uniref:type II toxin-antitoxin system RelB/DinJ family antitoxin n=1 Tax=Lancefieldella rimae TaxID=1383 RepID=UPI001CB5CC90|nr:type II toxin-antitoxin system RelB/DinJ family antitoxin [Lancefieldella rimae]MBF4804694.1 type II toxin-antitoxin system RelB/DinJ family antitoxin [Lancefieldella rimae]